MHASSDASEVPHSHLRLTGLVTAAGDLCYKAASQNDCCADVPARTRKPARTRRAHSTHGVENILWQQDSYKLMQNGCKLKQHSGASTPRSPLSQNQESKPRAEHRLGRVYQRRVNAGHGVECRQLRVMTSRVRHRTTGVRTQTYVTTVLCGCCRALTHTWYARCAVQICSRDGLHDI